MTREEWTKLVDRVQMPDSSTPFANGFVTLLLDEMDAFAAACFAAGAEQSANDIATLEQEARQMRARMERLEKDAARYKGIIEELWGIIDDIDTFSDMAKGNDAVFRELVERRQKHRWDTGIVTDGYTLNIDAAMAKGE